MADSTSRGCRPATIACATLAIAACTIQAWPFVSGVRLTADEVSWHATAMRGFDGVLDLFDWLLYQAKDQGRIGHTVNHAAHLFAAAVHEHVAARMAFVAAWFGMMYLFARFVTRVSGQGAPIVLFLVMTALFPLDFYHLPPTSFPLRFTPPIAGLLAVRLYLHAHCLEPSRPASVRLLAALTPVMWLFVIWEEYETAFAVALLLFHYGLLALREGDGLSGLRRLIARHRRLLAFEGLWLAVPVLLYVVFRLLKGEVYSGVVVGGTAGDALQTLVMHIVSGTGLDTLAAMDPSLLASAPLLGLVGATACLATMLLAAESPVSGRLALAAAGGCILMAVLVTLPVAATWKYQDWCMNGPSCLYSDVRLSYLWVISAGYFAVLAAARALRPAGRRALLTALCVLAASLFFVTHARNVEVAERMSERTAVLARARVLACEQPDGWETLDDATLRSLIDPQELISMHPFNDRMAYWRLYLRHAAAQADCADPSR